MRFKILVNKNGIESVEETNGTMFRWNGINFMLHRSAEWFGLWVVSEYATGKAVGGIKAGQPILSGSREVAIASVSEYLNSIGVDKIVAGMAKDRRINF